MRKNFHTIILLLILTITVLVTYNVSIVRREMTENQYNALINDLRRDATTFGLWVNQKTSILNTAKEICSNFSLEQLIATKTGNPYLSINKDDPSISEIYIGLSDGSFVTGGQWIPPDDYDPRTRTWYIEALEANRTILSKPYSDRETGDTVITISSPLYLDKTFVGVISADVFLVDIKDFLTTQIEKGYSYTSLIDENGTLIINTRRPDLEGQNIYTDFNLPDLIDYFNLAKETNSIVRMAYTHEGDDIIGIVQKVDGRNWYLAVTSMNQASFIEVLLGQKWLLVINGLFLIIILFLIYIIMKRRLELHNDNELLKTENEIDFLTGIYNRRYLNLYLEGLWHRKDNALLSLLLLDVDYFKDYNDTYGHILGDEVLKTLTHCIHDSIRKNDVFARFGGEEFAIILEHVDRLEAQTIGLKIIDAVFNLNIPHKTSPFNRITISIGAVTLKQHHNLSVRDAIDQADKALYKAKETGRNCLSTFED